MRERVIKLDLDTEDLPTTYQLFGISSHVRDYRLCWALNRELELDLSRTTEELTGRDGVDVHNLFRCAYSEQELCYTLVQNRTVEGLVWPELKQADFVFLVQFGEDCELRDYNNQLKNTQFVNVVFSLDPAKWSSVFHLIGADGY